MKAIIISCVIMVCFSTLTAQNSNSSSQEKTKVVVKTLQNNVWKYEDKDKKTTSFFSIDDSQRMSLLVVTGKDSMRFPDYCVDYSESKPEEILFKTIIDTLGAKYFCFVKVMVKDVDKIEMKQAYTIGGDNNKQNDYQLPQYGAIMEYKQINCCTNHDPHHCVNGLSEMLSFCKAKKCTF